MEGMVLRIVMFVHIDKSKGVKRGVAGNALNVERYLEIKLLLYFTCILPLLLLLHLTPSCSVDYTNNITYFIVSTLLISEVSV